SAPSDPADPSPSVVPSRLIPVTAPPEAPAAGEAPHGRASSVGGTPAVPTSPEHLNTRTPEPLNTEQVLNRGGTGPSPTDKLWDRLLAALAPPPPAQPAPATPETTAVPPAPDLTPPTSAPLTDAAASLD